MISNESLLALLLFSIAGCTALTSTLVQPTYSSSSEESSDEGEQMEPASDEEPVSEEPGDESEPEPEPEPVDNTNVNNPDGGDPIEHWSAVPYSVDQTTNVSSSTTGEENTTQIVQLIEERGGGNPFKGLNVDKLTKPCKGTTITVEPHKPCK
jgi:hypothetical protein